MMIRWDPWSGEKHTTLMNMLYTLQETDRLYIIRSVLFQRQSWPPPSCLSVLKRLVSPLSQTRLSSTPSNHSILLTRLDSTFGIRDLALSFFRSYLQDRTQVVTVNGIKSPLLLTCGVPQGSVLGPILFILYTQPLSDIISHHSVFYKV